MSDLKNFLFQQIQKIRRKRYVPLFQSNFLPSSTIKYARDILTNSPVIENIKPAQLNLRWTDVPLVDHDLAIELGIPTKPIQSIEEYGIQLIDRDALVVCEMGPLAGRGVMTLQEIKCGQIVCLYAGIIFNKKQYEEMCKRKHPFRSFGDSTTTKNSQFFTCCETIDSFGSFIQHLPMHNPNFFQPDLATQNLQIEVAVYGSINFLKVVAACDIPANSLLGINYGRGFWQALQEIAERRNETFYLCYFSKEGELLGYVNDIDMEILSFSATSIAYCKDTLKKIDLNYLGSAVVQKHIISLARQLSLRHHEILNHFNSAEINKIFQLRHSLKHHGNIFHQEIHSSNGRKNFFAQYAKSFYRYYALAYLDQLI